MNKHFSIKILFFLFLLISNIFFSQNNNIEYLNYVKIEKKIDSLYDINHNEGIKLVKFYIKKSKKDKSITYPSIYPAEPEAANRTDGMDRIELIEAYREIIKENIEYDLLVLRYGRERLDEALELMLEVILSKRPYIRIAGDDFPREIVKSRFLKINSGHLEYVFDCIDKNTTKVGNIKAYLLAALYNAPATMDSYYRAEVNHDLYGC